MSLVRLAHRVCAVEAIKGRTLAGDGVEDSAIPPIDKMVEGQRKPFIAVYTDEQERSWRQLDPNRDKDALTLVFEIGVTAQIRIQEDDGPEYQWAYPVPTDAALEHFIDTVERQIDIALKDEANPWAEVWRRLHSGDPAYTSMRGASAEKGMHFAGRQFMVTVEARPDPPFGPAASGVWAEFLDLLDTTESPIAANVRSLIEADASPPDWAVISRRFGMTAGEASALGYAPADPDNPDATIDGFDLGELDEQRRTEG